MNHVNIWGRIVCVMIWYQTYRHCRKSDFKRIIFTKVVQKEIKDYYATQLEQLNEKDATNENAEIKELYEKYLEEQKDYFLGRLQPDAVGSTRNITLTGNRKQSLTIETISKRRPLIFQIDDFLFDDECDYIIKSAHREGLEWSKTGGEYLQQAGLETSDYDHIGELKFRDIDLDGDMYINGTELQMLIRASFANKMGMVLVNDIMKKTLLDFNLDGKIAEWEWNSKNITRLVAMLNESIYENPASKIRYSAQQWLESNIRDEVLQSIQNRLHQLLGLPIPMLRNSEDLQVVRYQPGGHYDCHLDSEPRYFPDEYRHCCHLLEDTEEAVDCNACRFLTILYYLEDVDYGGETAFPVVGLDPYENNLSDEKFGSSQDWCDLSVHCQMAKVIVKPKKGRAVLWYNHFIHPDTNWTGPVDPNSLHGGCAVHKGHKWIANNWINAGFDKQHDILSWARTEVRRRNDEMTK